MPTFDWTIKLGELIAVAAFILAGIGLYATLDKRVVVLEQAREYNNQINAAQDKRVDDLKVDLLLAMRDIRASVDRLADRVAVVPPTSRKR